MLHLASISYQHWIQIQTKYFHENSSRLNSTFIQHYIPFHISMHVRLYVCMCVHHIIIIIPQHHLYYIVELHHPKNTFRSYGTHTTCLYIYVKFSANFHIRFVQMCFVVHMYPTYLCVWQNFLIWSPFCSSR